MSTHEISLTDEQLENVRREMMKAASTSLTIAAEALHGLAEVGPWDDASRSRTTDVLGAVEIARVDLASLDALGWPDNDRGD